MKREDRQSQMLEPKFQGLLASAPDAMVIRNEAGLLVLVNAQTERLFGYSRDELIGAPVEILTPDASVKSIRPSCKHISGTRSRGPWAGAWSLTAGASTGPSSPPRSA